MLCPALLHMIALLYHLQKGLRNPGKSWYEGVQTSRAEHPLGTDAEIKLTNVCGVLLYCYLQYTSPRPTYHHHTNHYSSHI